MTATPAIAAVDAATLTHKPMRYFDFLMAAFVAILLLSNLIGAAKTAYFATPWLHAVFPWMTGLTFGAGILFFPVSYVLGDVLTEVYGYARARRCVWVGFFALIFMAFMSVVVVAMPLDRGWECAASHDAMFAAVLRTHDAGTICQATYVSVFGSTWRIVAASLAAFWAGEFVNSLVLARMKVWTKGRWLFTRTWSSTICGQAVDSLLFYPLAFAGVWSTERVVLVLITNWALKVLWEILLTPATYWVVGFLKRAEGVDVYDTHTNFTPFAAAV